MAERIYHGQTAGQLGHAVLEVISLENGKEAANPVLGQIKD